MPTGKKSPFSLGDTSEVSVWGQGQDDMCVNTETFLERGLGSEPWVLELWWQGRPSSA